MTVANPRDLCHVYAAMEREAEGVLECFREDLTVHDRSVLDRSERDDVFAWVLTPSSTHLVAASLGAAARLSGRHHDLVRVLAASPSHLDAVLNAERGEGPRVYLLELAAPGQGSLRRAAPEEVRRRIDEELAGATRYARVASARVHGLGRDRLPDLGCALKSLWPFADPLWDGYTGEAWAVGGGHLDPADRPDALADRVAAAVREIAAGFTVVFTMSKPGGERPDFERTATSPCPPTRRRR